MAGFNSLKQIFQKERTERQFGLHPDFFFFSCLPYSVSEPLQPTFTEKCHRETGSRRSRCWVTFSIRHPMLLPAQPRVCDPLEACPGSPEFSFCVSLGRRRHGAFPGDRRMGHMRGIKDLMEMSRATQLQFVLNINGHPPVFKTLFLPYAFVFNTHTPLAVL